MESVESTHCVYFVSSVIRWHVHAQYANQVSGWGAGIVNQTKQVEGYYMCYSTACIYFSIDGEEKHILLRTKLGMKSSVKK